MPDRNSRTLFTPLTPAETPEADQNLCETFNRAMAADEIEPLLLIANFIKTMVAAEKKEQAKAANQALPDNLKCGFWICHTILPKLSNDRHFFHLRVQVFPRISIFVFDNQFHQSINCRVKPKMLW